MITEETRYLIRHFLHLLPLDEKSKIKYPYLNESERDEEKARLADIIKDKFKEQIFWNFCPKCEKLARTPKAKQCRYCNYDWH